MILDCTNPPIVPTIKDKNALINSIFVQLNPLAGCPVLHTNSNKNINIEILAIVAIKVVTIVGTAS